MTAGQHREGARDDLLPTVVLGGMRWPPQTSYPSVQNVAELARTRPTLYIYPEGYGRLPERVGRLIEDTSFNERRGLAATPMRLRRESETLWLASIGGLFSLFPLAAGGLLRRWHVRRCTAVIRRWLREIGAQRCAIITYWWFVGDVLRDVPEAQLTIYDCVDDHTQYPGSRLNSDTVARSEAEVLDRVDRTYVVSPKLLESRQAPGRSLTVLPNAFDIRMFEELRERGFTVPEKLAAARRPIIGFLGTMGGRVDWPLLGAVISARPEWTFVFIGGDAHLGPAEIMRRPNVLLLGVLPYEEALGAASAFDVATIPFLVHRFAQGNSFAKLLDYLAHGLPVVAPPLPDTEGIAAEGDGLIYLATGADAWIAAIEQALAEPADAPVRDARRGIVERRSVPRRVARMLAGGEPA